jgi:hypothetical protein
VEDNICPCCRREVETTLHVIWNCPATQDVWGGGSILFQKSSFMGENFMQLWNIVSTGFLRRMWGYWSLLLDVFGCEEINLFLKISSPNRKLFIRKHTKLMVIIVKYTFTRNMGDTFEKLQCLLTSWQPPPNVILKVN